MILIVYPLDFLQKIPYSSLKFIPEPMTYTTWSAAPATTPADEAEFFTSEHHAVDVAYDWSIELGGKPVWIYRNGLPWMEVVA